MVDDKKDRVGLSKANQILLVAQNGNIKAKNILYIFPDSNNPRVPAGMYLKRMAGKGLLIREKINVSQGGITYVYSLSSQGRKKCAWLKDQGY